jgi:hypothetical protein
MGRIVSVKYFSIAAWLFNTLLAGNASTYLLDLYIYI